MVPVTLHGTTHEDGMLLTITYFSSATDPFDPRRLAGLLEQVRPLNRARGLTGLLIYCSGSFAQALEGPEDAVRPVFDRISVDPRHRGVFVAHEELADERAFPDWSMSFRDLTGATTEDVEGFSTFLHDVRAGRSVAGGTSAHHMLRAFSRRGRAR